MRFRLLVLMGWLAAGPAFAADPATAVTETATAPDILAGRTSEASRAPMSARGPRLDPVGEDPLERQVLDVAAELRCTVCQNQPVSQSDADLARDMRAIIREQLLAGRTHDEIIDYFVERYGDYVLLKPRQRGAGLVVWAVPAGVFVVLAVSAALFLRKRSHAASPPPPELSAEDAARVARARAGERQA